MKINESITIFRGIYNARYESGFFSSCAYSELYINLLELRVEREVGVSTCVSSYLCMRRQCRCKLFAGSMKINEQWRVGERVTHRAYIVTSCNFTLLRLTAWSYIQSELLRKIEKFLILGKKKLKFSSF